MECFNSTRDSLVDCFQQEKHRRCPNLQHKKRCRVFWRMDWIVRLQEANVAEMCFLHEDETLHGVCDLGEGGIQSFWLCRRRTRMCYLPAVLCLKPALGEILHNFCWNFVLFVEIASFFFAKWNVLWSFITNRLNSTSKKRNEQIHPIVTLVPSTILWQFQITFCGSSPPSAFSPKPKLDD